MTPEFVDVTVRMKPDKEDAFRQVISNSPHYDVVKAVKKIAPPESKPVPEMSWEEELLDLRAAVMEVKEAIARKDQIASGGFSKLNTFNHSMHPTEFIRGVLGVLERSVSVYEAFDEKPGSSVPKKAFKYREVGGALTPRYVRLAIGLYALNGKEVPREDVLKREGVAQASYYGYVGTLEVALAKYLKR